MHNRTSWEAKFARNLERDEQVEASLTDLGLRVVTVWECEVKDSLRLKNTLTGLLIGEPSTDKPL